MKGGVIMSIKKSVFSSSNNKKMEVRISSNKPKIDDETLKKWQNILNIISTVFNFSTSTIMQITENQFQVLITSENPNNPLDKSCPIENLEHRLYDEIISRNSELIISNISDNNLFNQICTYNNTIQSFYGKPIRWPDEEFFGTIFVMDEKPNNFDPTFRALIEEFTAAIESDLRILVQSEQLEYLASKDPLTGIYNRRRINQLFINEFSRARRFNEYFSILLIDIDRFKLINDLLGHQGGDDVLKFFVDIILSRIRVVDMLGRWSGDEFLLICPNTDLLGAEKLKHDVVEAVENHNVKNMPDLSCSVGLAEYCIETQTVQELFDLAEYQLSKDKNHYKNKS